VATRQRRSTGRGRLSAPRRKRIWFFEENSLTFVGASSKSLDVLGDARTSLGVNGFPGYTIGAIIGQLYVEPTLVAAGETIDTRYGLVVASQQATIGSLPIPWQEDGDFMWTDTVFRSFVTTGGQDSHTDRTDVRVRSMRKLEEVDDTLFLIVRQNAATDVVVRWRLRLLLLVP